ncbi:pectin lyase-like protein [Agrocybe pediades]|nr:pectin lyase-like protein [Agrocybe pediades]
MLFSSRYAFLALVAFVADVALGASRTSPPSGAVIVRAVQHGPSSSIQEPTQSKLTSRVLDHLLFMAATAGSDDVSGTVRVHKNDFKLYNVNVKNTFGQGSQAIAISQYGTRVGFYGCGFYGFQDTVLVEQGVQVFLKGFIQGATDFIFGQRGQAFFGGNTIAVTAPGYVTASGRSSNDNTSYVFDGNTIVLGSGAASTTAGKFYLGRPWSDYAKVIFKNTVVNVALNSAVWSIWSTSTPNTDHVFFADYNTTGSGIAGASRATFATQLTASQAAAYSISSAVGSDYATWVDTSYL